MCIKHVELALRRHIGVKECGAYVEGPKGIEGCMSAIFAMLIAVV